MYVVAQPQAVVHRPVPFELLLFSTDTDFVQQAATVGVDGFIVDWEYRGKQRRQAGADTQINHDTPADLRRVRTATQRRVICRINGWSSTTVREVEQAIAAGADEILLPMVRGAAEVEHVLELIRGRCDLGILVETLPAIRQISSFGRLPLSRVYVGLNDLAIARGTRQIFMPLVDGTLEHIRRHISTPFGFGGVTLPERGVPIPCRLLMGELARLHCSFTFLRRSFCADTRGRDLNVEVPRIRAALHAAFHRPGEAVVCDQAALHAAIASWPQPALHAAQPAVARAIG